MKKYIIKVKDYKSKDGKTQDLGEVKERTWKKTKLMIDTIVKQVEKKGFDWEEEIEVIENTTVYTIIVKKGI